ncbi:protein of unassigned function [Methylobacterium oryzae CBMB20]|uniref:Protein of unassigned function n=1 Tax=Methylobacterium oryzae CBMB20 TaxID=693986 RepID=A0A089QAA6_9HYPH|nr:protein of unassigned function [Methylobacterium oryzae CBMB20]
MLMIVSVAILILSAQNDLRPGCDHEAHIWDCVAKLVW